MKVCLNMLLTAQYVTSSVAFHSFLKCLFCIFGAASRSLGAVCVFLVCSTNSWIVILKHSNNAALSEWCPCLCIDLSFLPCQAPFSD